MEGLHIGQLVRSVAGRDKGKFYLIYDVLDEAFVRVIDGDKKRLTNPKRKNVKHLRFFPEGAFEMAERWRDGASVQENEVSEALRTLGLSHKD